MREPDDPIRTWREEHAALTKGCTIHRHHHSLLCEGHHIARATSPLGLVHRLLTDPRHSGSTISAIAFGAGFGDLSYFNHAFRRRYGATPSEIRTEMQHRGNA